MGTDIKSIIISSAMELFAENGYHNTKVKNIARNSNIADGLVYNYFNSKEELFNTIIRDSINNIIETYDLFNMEIQAASSGKICSNVLKTLYDHSNFWILTFEVLFNPETLKDSYNMIKAKIDVPFLKSLTNYLKNTEIVDYEERSNLLFVAIYGMYYSYLFKEKERNKETYMRYIKHIHEIFLRN